MLTIEATGHIGPPRRYLSVRGPVTAGVLRRQSGIDVQSMGDPGALLSRILPVERGAIVLLEAGTGAPQVVAARSRQGDAITRISSAIWRWCSRGSVCRSRRRCGWTNISRIIRTIRSAVI